MQEHHLAVAKTARYYSLGEPGPATRQLWFVCHGYGQLAGRFLRHFEPLDDGSRVIIAPEGLSRFYLSESPAERRVGASWMTREDRLVEIEDYVRYLDAVHDHVRGGMRSEPVSVHAIGFSQGAATVSRWAALGKTHVDRLVLWGGEFPPWTSSRRSRSRRRCTWGSSPTPAASCTRTPAPVRTSWRRS